MKIAIAQLNPTIGDLTGNAQKILAAAHQAAEQGARLLLTPELSLCGYPPRDLLMHPGFIASMSAMLERLAHDLPRSLLVLVGTVEMNPNALLQGGKPLFNSMALLEDGKIRQIFHKRLLPTYDVFDEDRYFEPGHEANHFVLEIEAEGQESEVRGSQKSEDAKLKISPLEMLREQNLKLKTLSSHSPLLPIPYSPRSPSASVSPSAKTCGTMKNFGANAATP